MRIRARLTIIGDSRGSVVIGMVAFFLFSYVVLVVSAMVVVSLFVDCLQLTSSSWLMHLFRSECCLHLSVSVSRM